MIWFLVALSFVGIVSSFYLMVEHANAGDRGLSYYWAVFMVIFVILFGFQFSDATHSDVKCKTYHEQVGEHGRVTIRLCGDKELHFNGKTYRGPG